jgi:hypothetical protein
VKSTFLPFETILAQSLKKFVDIFVLILQQLSCKRSSDTKFKAKSVCSRAGGGTFLFVPGPGAGIGMF